MRKLLILLAGALSLSACEGTTGPDDFSIVGTWESVGFEPAQVQMTLVETARSPTGAGRWVEPGDADAFRVTGATVDDRVSLLLDFDDGARRDINFFGQFREEDTAGDDGAVLVGELYGGGFSGQPIRFRRVDFEESV